MSSFMSIYIDTNSGLSWNNITKKKKIDRLSFWMKSNFTLYKYISAFIDWNLGKAIHFVNKYMC